MQFPSKTVHIRAFAAVAGLGCVLSAAAQMGGVSTGAAAAPVYDAEHRPITAGGFVDHGPIVFRDITK